MSPGDSRIRNRKAIKNLKNQTITGVDLVYTDYPEGEDFSALNRRRIIELFGLLPFEILHLTTKW